MEKEITARYTDRCACDCDNCVECNCDPKICRCKGHIPVDSETDLNQSK